MVLSCDCSSSLVPVSTFLHCWDLPCSPGSISSCAGTICSFNCLGILLLLMALLANSCKHMCWCWWPVPEFACTCTTPLSSCLCCSVQHWSWVYNLYCTWTVAVDLFYPSFSISCFSTLLYLSFPMTLALPRLHPHPATLHALHQQWQQRHQASWPPLCRSFFSSWQFQLFFSCPTRHCFFRCSLRFHVSLQSCGFDSLDWHYFHSILSNHSHSVSVCLHDWYDDMMTSIFYQFAFLAMLKHIYYSIGCISCIPLILDTGASCCINPFWCWGEFYMHHPMSVNITDLSSKVGLRVRAWFDGKLLAFIGRCIWSTPLTTMYQAHL